MSKINAVKNSIYRSTHLRSGKGISRVYHNTKNLSGLNMGFATIEMLFALNSARYRHTFNTIFMGGLSMYFAKKAVDLHDLQAGLYEYYRPIVDRAKQIYRKG